MIDAVDFLAAGFVRMSDGSWHRQGGPRPEWFRCEHDWRGTEDTDRPFVVYVQPKLGLARVVVVNEGGNLPATVGVARVEDGDTLEDVFRRLAADLRAAAEMIAGLGGTS